MIGDLDAYSLFEMIFTLFKRLFALRSRILKLIISGLVSFKVVSFFGVMSCRMIGSFSTTLRDISHLCRGILFFSINGLGTFAVLVTNCSNLILIRSWGIMAFLLFIIMYILQFILVPNLLLATKFINSFIYEYLL